MARQTPIIRWILLLLAGCAASVGYFSSAAHQTMAVAAGCTKYNTEIWNADGVDHYGVGAFSQGIYMGSGAATCARVSSIALVFDTQDNVEGGWARSPGSGGGTCTPDNSADKAFEVAVVSGSYECQGGPVVGPDGDYGDFKILDPSKNNFYRYSYNDVPYGNGFFGSSDAGTPLANGERHSTADPGYADFLHMQLLKTNLSWYDWTNPALHFNNDPTLNANCYSAIHVGVTTSNRNLCG